jgi:hypothetical protein
MTLSISQALPRPLSLQFPLCLLIIFRSIDTVLLQCQSESPVESRHLEADASTLTWL